MDRTVIKTEEELPGLPPAPRRRGERTRTIPEQIADHVGLAIVNGEYRPAERVREQELATLYGVSRGPVREAIRVLARRGLVDFYPRRGAYVVDLSLDAIADVFDIRAALMSLAARCFAERADVQARALLRLRFDELEQLAHSADVDPVRFARFVGRTGAVIARHCGNGHLTRMLSEQAEHSLWGLIWRERPLDFLERERRLEAAADYRALVAAIDAGHGRNAEHLQHRILLVSRDHVITMLRRTRQENPVDRSG